jgi:hypothetical protein
MRRIVPAVFPVLLLIPISALSDSGNPLPAEDDQWRFTVAFPMLWAPQISGKIRGDESIDFTIDFKDILDNLSFGIMAELYANKGPYGLAFRTNYMRVENEMSRTGLVDIQAQTKTQMGVNDLLASFGVHEKVRLVTGVRHVFAKVDLHLQTSIGDSDLVNELIPVTDDNQFDWLLGVNYSHWFAKRWGIMLNADVGVFGANDRDFSLEFRALYRISDLNNFWFGYRYLNIGSDTETNGVKYSVDMSQLGPMAGWAFTF